MSLLRKLTKNPIDYLTDSMREFFQIRPYKDIITFALQDIDMADDISAARKRIQFDTYPYLPAILKQAEYDPQRIKQVVVAMPQQMGKTCAEICILLHAISYNQLSAIIAYPSLELAKDIGVQKYQTLLRKLPLFASEIKSRKAKISEDRIRLSSAHLNFVGAGTKIVARSASLILGDQVAIFPQFNGIDNIAELKKRTRSYSGCLQVFVSTPNEKDKFWREFEIGSCGYYHLRCQHCGSLSMRACDIHNLQFESEYDQSTREYRVTGEPSLICPICKHQHHQEDHLKMVQEGDYIHQHPDRLEGQISHASFQVGILASLLPIHNFSQVAQAQLNAGKTSSMEDKKTFINSYRGLPFDPSTVKLHDRTSEIKKHIFKDVDLKTEDIEAVLLVADQQDMFSVVGRFALTKQNNLYLIDIRRPEYLFLSEEDRAVINGKRKLDNQPPVQTLIDMLDETYRGIRPLCLFSDSRGHTTQKVREMARLRRNIILYQGTNLKMQLYKWSDKVDRTVNFDAHKLTAEFVYQMYYQKNQAESYLYLSESLTDEDLDEIEAFQPDNTRKDGNKLQNWCPYKDRVHDTADVIRMAYGLLHILKTIYRKEKFIHGEARCLRNQILVKKPKRKTEPKPPTHPIQRF